MEGRKERKKMERPKQQYSTPRLTIYGDIAALTQGPIKPKTGDNPVGGINSDSCKPLYGKICS
jgi:hypothetical protein